MDLDHKKYRLLLLIIDSFPEDMDIRSLSNLPYIGMLSKNGVWAKVTGTGEISGELTFESFSTLQLKTSPTPKQLWNFLEENGITAKIFSVTSSSPLFDQIPVSVLTATDWEFLGVITSHSEQGKKALKRLNHDEMRVLDKEIEAIALAAGEETAVWVVSLPFSTDEAGWFIAGGAQVAPSGNPGAVTSADIIQTMLWWFNIDSALEKEGRILEEIREKDTELSQDEMDLLTDHLRGLGYLG